MKLHLLGCASGIAGADLGSGNGPLTMQKSTFLADLSVPVVWKDMLKGVPGREMDKAVSTLCTALAKQTAKLTRDKAFFSVLGGDHSCAIGTWSGVFDAKYAEGDIGLIWIDAHMDSHTPETSETGRIHGMPLAALMGHGYAALTEILNKQPKFKPENVCLIGVRSYESGEADLLKRLNVKVYFMDEVKQRGFDAVLQEAVKRVSQHTIGYGISLDLDGIDPLDAPGVDVPEPDGIRALDLQEGLKNIAHDPRLIAVEIVEFDPQYDEDRKTEQLVVSVLEILAQGRMAYGHKA
ncbi:MAG: arginase [Gammaproteobacteria bacterium]